jgi:hypothetical protein
MKGERRFDLRPLPIVQLQPNQLRERREALVCPGDPLLSSSALGQDLEAVDREREPLLDRTPSDTMPRHRENTSR